MTMCSVLSPWGHGSSVSKQANDLVVVKCPLLEGYHARHAKAMQKRPLPPWHPNNKHHPWNTWTPVWKRLKLLRISYARPDKRFLVPFGNTLLFLFYQLIISDIALAATLSANHPVPFARGSLQACSSTPTASTTCAIAVSQIHLWYPQTSKTISSWHRPDSCQVRAYAMYSVYRPKYN